MSDQLITRMTYLTNQAIELKNDQIKKLKDALEDMIALYDESDWYNDIRVDKHRELLEALK